MFNLKDVKQELQEYINKNLYKGKPETLGERVHYKSKVKQGIHEILDKHKQPEYKEVEDWFVEFGMTKREYVYSVITNDGVSDLPIIKIDIKTHEVLYD